MSNTLNTLVRGQGVIQKQTEELGKNIALKNAEGHLLTKQYVTQDEHGAPRVSKPHQVKDDLLLREIHKLNSRVEGGNETNRYFERLDILFGLKGNQATFADLGAKMSNALHSFALGSITGEQALNTINNHVKELNQLASQVHQIRKDAENDINSAYQRANQLIVEIKDISGKIESLNNHENTNDLEDQRRNFFQELSGLIEISEDTDTGRYRIFTKNNDLIIDGDRYSKLVFTPLAESFNPDSAASPITLEFASGVTKDITNELQIEHGKIGSLLRVRDEFFYNFQAQLDEYTSTLRDEFNKIHNEGTALNTPNTLTGTIGIPGNTAALTGTEVISGNGELRLALLDQNNDFVKYADINLSTITDVNDFINTVNTVTDQIGGGIGLDITASLTTDGRLNLSSTDTTKGIAFGAVDGQPKPELSLGAIFDTNNAYGASHFFGLNNLFDSPGFLPTGSQIGVTQNLSIRSDIISSHGSVMSLGQLKSDTINPINPVMALEKGDKRTISALEKKYNDSTTKFDQIGGMPSKVTSLKNYGFGIVQSQAQTAKNVKIETESYEKVYETLTTRAKNISGVNEKTIMAELMKLALSNTLATNAMSMVIKMVRELTSAMGN